MNTGILASGCFLLGLIVGYLFTLYHYDQLVAVQDEYAGYLRVIAAKLRKR